MTGRRRRPYELTHPTATRSPIHLAGRLRHDGFVTRPLPRRRNPRLRDFDYLAGIFFVTVVAHRRRCLFGEVRNDEMHVNRGGDSVTEEWLRSEVRPDVVLDAFVVMPNHFHAIVGLTDGPTSLPKLMNAFKAASTRGVREAFDDHRLLVWQRSYFEHVVRDERGLERIREYIVTNPVRWQMDRENPDGLAVDPFERWLIDEGKRALPGDSRLTAGYT
jgi:putative transposase